MNMIEESEKVVLKFNIKKTKIMASGPINSWQIDGENMETVRDFIFLGSKITADGDCSHEIKRHFLFGKRATTNLDNIFKSRDITLPTKVHLVKAMIFPVVMYRYEKVKVKMKVTQSCLTLCNIMDCSTPGSSLSSTISCSLLKFMSIESMMLSNHFILCNPPSSSALNHSQHQGLFH